MTGTAEANFSPFRVATRISALTLLFLACLPLHLIAKAGGRRSPWPPRFLGAAARIIGARVTTNGAPIEPHSLLVSNHLTWLDVLILGGATGCAFVSKDEVDDPNPAIGTRVKGSSTEFAIGVRKVWGQKATHPHLGAGADVIHVEEEFFAPFGNVTNEDRAYGAWVDAGVTWRIASHLNLGIEARYSYALATLGTGSLARDVAAGGIHLGVLVGFGW